MSDFGELTFQDTKSDLYYNYISRTDKKYSYEYMFDREEKRFNFHLLAAKRTNGRVSDWHLALSKSARRRLEKWTKLMNEEIL